MENDTGKIAVYDLWAGAVTSKNITPFSPDLENYSLLQMKKKVPQKCVAKTKDSRKRAAVEVPHPGSSYNPTLDDHTMLVTKAYKIEKRKERLERRLERHLQLPSSEELVTPEIKLEEATEGLPAGNDEDEEDEDIIETEESYQPATAPVIAENRRPEKARKREQLRKKLARKQRDDKLKRIRQGDVYRIRSIKKEIKRQEEEWKKERERKKRRREELGRMMPAKLGPVRYEPPDEAALLSTELPGSLLELKPEGSLLEDRYKSLQKRGIVEPRTMRNRSRKYKLKVYEKRSHRDMPAGYVPR